MKKIASFFVAGLYRASGVAMVIAFMVTLSGGLYAGGKREPVPAAPQTRIWTDSAGREVEIPVNIQRIAPSGSLAQIILYTLCPDKIVGWSSSFSDTQKKYFPEKYWDKPAFGQFYGRNVSLNMEALAAAAPDLIIDIGEAKRTIKEDMDGIQAQTGIPVIFVEAVLDTMSDAYLKLGDITGETALAAELARYVDETLADAAAKKASIPEGKRVRVYFGEGKTGQDANVAGTVHADVIEYVGGLNVGTIDALMAGGATSVSMEQIILWNPDLILFGTGNFYGAAAGDQAWQGVPAFKANRYYEVPLEPYSWMGRPPSVNRLIGIKWLGNLLYPDVFNYDMVAEAKRFFKLFYHYDLRDDEARALMARSTFKAR